MLVDWLKGEMVNNLLGNKRKKNCSHLSVQVSEGRFSYNAESFSFNLLKLDLTSIKR